MKTSKELFVPLLSGGVLLVGLLILLTSCVDHWLWTAQHMPPPREYASIANPIVHSRVVSAPERLNQSSGTSADSRGLASGPPLVALVFDPQSRQIVHMVGLGNSTSMPGPAAYDPSTGVDWALVRYERRILGINRATGAIIPDTHYLGDHVPGWMTPKVRSDGRVLIHFNDVLDPMGRTLVGIYNMRTKIMEKTWPTNANGRTFWDGDRYVYMTCYENGEGQTVSHFMILFDLQELTMTEVHRSSTGPDADEVLFINGRHFLVVDTVYNIWPPTPEFEIWEIDPSTAAILGKKTIPRPVSDEFYYAAGEDAAYNGKVVLFGVPGSGSPNRFEHLSIYEFDPGTRGVPSTWTLVPSGKPKLPFFWTDIGVRDGERNVFLSTAIKGVERNRENTTYYTIFNLRTKEIEFSDGVPFPLLP